MKKLTLGSLFDGIGGFPLAAQRCGIETLWTSEIESNCIGIAKRHFPETAHLGSITMLDGGKLAPVDIISFGSPCQDLSCAGVQKGMKQVCPACGEEFEITDKITHCPKCNTEIEKTRSGLFVEAVRIIYEMRCATNGKYPTFAIWENVPGAFNSNCGGDFRTVLEELTKSNIPMPDSGKWASAGMVRTCNVEIAWRQLDSQYWGVPQRRKRIFLVADFGGQRAAEILFKCESLLGYSKQSAAEEKRVAATVGSRVEKTGQNCIDESSFHCVYELTHADEVIRRGKENICPTLQARMGTGGNQTPLVLDVDTSAKKSSTDYLTAWDNQEKRVFTPRGVSPTLAGCDGGGGRTSAGYLFHVLEARPINDAVIHGKANGFGIGANGEPAPTLTGRDRHGIAIFEEYGHSKYRETDIAGVLRAQGRSCGPGSESLVALPEERAAATMGGRLMLLIRYILRKLTPLECERLQGYPDEWTRYSATGAEIKDSPRYMAIGNSLAVPCAERVFRGVVAVMEKSSQNDGGNDSDLGG